MVNLFYSNKKETVNLFFFISIKQKGVGQFFVQKSPFKLKKDINLKINFWSKRRWSISPSHFNQTKKNLSSSKENKNQKNFATIKVNNTCERELFKRIRCGYSPSSMTNKIEINDIKIREKTTISPKNQRQKI